MQAFRAFLKKGGRSERAEKRAIAYVCEFEKYLRARCGKGLDEAEVEDLQAFVALIEGEQKASAKGHLWGVAYYYEYKSNEEMRRMAGVLRQQRIERKPFALKDFRGVTPEVVEKLAEVGVRDVRQMLRAGASVNDRQTLAEQTGLAAETVLELVKLSDLARIPGVKGVRSRLYVDAGVDTVAKLALWEPEALRLMLADFVERTGFDGAPVLPAEARFTVAQAKGLPQVVQY